MDLQPGKGRYSVKDMCGLAGIYAGLDERPAKSLLLAMAGELRHRGPDGTGLLLDGRMGMASARLAIVDLEGGDQPLSDETGALLGDAERRDLQLRRAAERAARAWATDSPRRRDTEVIAHAYEEWGTDCLAALQRRLRDRRLGSRAARAVPRARSVRRPAAVPGRIRRRHLLCLRGQGAPPPSCCAAARSTRSRVVDAFTRGRLSPTVRPSRVSASYPRPTTR